MVNTQPVTIRRYRNRKMYMVNESKYVSLSDLAAIVRDGAELLVYRHEDGVDVTSDTLASIAVAQPPADTAGLYAAIRSGVTG